MKYGVKEYTVAPLSHAIFGHDQQRGGYRSPPKFKIS